MTLRRKARELALQLLYQWEAGGESPEKAEKAFWQGAKAAAQTREFAHRLFTGTVAAAPQLDALVERHATNWRLDRMSAIDRNILRLAAFELKFATAPARVVLDEAVELAKKFSDDAAPAFVNGVLDAVASGEWRVVNGEKAGEKEEREKKEGEGEKKEE
ncbi:MAG TPA: transcription antitermination factor NusB [Candidatus Acidoferrales bacterium]|nr:transcription antitermination factor NusB [Candidatus Acidoferrales bacterium]